MKIKRLGFVSIVVVALVLVTLGVITRFSGIRSGAITKEEIAQALSSMGRAEELPTEVKLPLSGKDHKVLLQYSYDPNLQETMKALFKSYDPDYGAFVAIDPQTGRVVSMVSYSRGNVAQENLALRASFPSASVFKVVTAAAAISEEKLSADTVIPVNGRYHTLYRSQVLKDKVTPWTRYVTLRDAFARSVNSAFGKLGVRSVGAEKLREYAERFGFNQIITSDVPIEIGRALISDDPWDVAEAASGYTRDNTMSPLHGALIAAAVANDGMMMEPFVVQSAHKEDGSTVYSATPREIKRVVDPSAAAEIRELMRQTVASGTSRSSFRGFFKGQFSDLNVGGKTGSLTGMDPPGKYDWFVGFAEGGNTRLAVAAMTVHKKYWRVKSSYLARRAIERYFRDHAGDSAIPASVAAPVRNVKNNP